MPLLRAGIPVFEDTYERSILLIITAASRLAEMTCKIINKMMPRHQAPFTAPLLTPDQGSVVFSKRLMKTHSYVRLTVAGPTNVGSGLRLRQQWKASLPNRILSNMLCHRTQTHCLNGRDRL